MKFKTSMIKNKRQYICPAISHLSVKNNICASSYVGDHQQVDNGEDIWLLEVEK